MKGHFDLLSIRRHLANSVLPFGIIAVTYGQAASFPHNAVSCERCHNTPSGFGCSVTTVQRTGEALDGKFVPAAEGGIRHRRGESDQHVVGRKQLVGERVSPSLLGDGYIEAIIGDDIRENVRKEREANDEIAGLTVVAPILEANAEKQSLETGRFGWKSQHSSLMSSCADSLRNELGIRNRLYPNEYSTHSANDPPTPFDSPDPNTGKTELDRLVDEIRRTSPPAREEAIAATPVSHAGEDLFAQIGCAVCHVATYKTLPPGTKINGSTYKVPKMLGSKIIHPYSDFLLHDVGTGDGIPQAAKPEFLDQSTANKFRTPPLWGLRFRAGLMHDGESLGPEAAIERHAGEATKVRDRYEHLPPEQKKQLLTFLSSL